MHHLQPAASPPLTFYCRHMGNYLIGNTALCWYSLWFWPVNNFVVLVKASLMDSTFCWVRTWVPWYLTKYWNDYSSAFLHAINLSFFFIIPQLHWTIHLQPPSHVPISNENKWNHIHLLYRRGRLKRPLTDQTVEIYYQCKETKIMMAECVPNVSGNLK